MIENIKSENCLMLKKSAINWKNNNLVCSVSYILIKTVSFVLSECKQLENNQMCVNILLLTE